MDTQVEQDGVKKMEVKKQNSKECFEKNEHACSVEGVQLEVLYSTARLYLKLACPTLTNQILSKPQQFVIDK